LSHVSYDADAMCFQHSDKLLDGSGRVTNCPNPFHVLTHRITLRGWLGRDIILPFITTRIALCLVAWLGFRLLPLPSAFPLSWEIAGDGAAHFTTDGAPRSHSFVNMWSRWDSGWYLQIAKHGYHYDPGKPSSTAFFPLYPLSIRLLHAIFFLPDSDYWYLVIGIILSNICLLVGVFYLYQLTRLDYNESVAGAAVLCLLLFPTSFFLSAAYSESMFLALTISSFYYARKQYWLTASLLAGLAALCRSQGITLTVALLAEYIWQHKCNPRLVRWNALALSLVPAGLGALLLYFRLAFGSWTLVNDSQRPWGRRFLAPWHTFAWVLGHHSRHDWLDFSFFLLLALMAAVACRRLRASYAVYLVTAVVFFSCWGMLGSMPRFVLVVFPMFIVLSLAAERSQAFRVSYLTISCMLAGIFFFMHSQWNWVA
jgi:Mannosyltransferase (PIG-V)